MICFSNLRNVFKFPEKSEVTTRLCLVEVCTISHALDKTYMARAMRREALWFLLISFSCLCVCTHIFSSRFSKPLCKQSLIMNSKLKHLCLIPHHSAHDMLCCHRNQWMSWARRMWTSCGATWTFWDRRSSTSSSSSQYLRYSLVLIDVRIRIVNYHCHPSH